MKVLFVAEGKHELSVTEHETSPLVELVRRLLPSMQTFERCRVSDHRVRVHMRRGRSLNYGKRLEAWVRYAAANGFDALVLVIDEDGDHERVHGVDLAQQSQVAPVARACGIAIRTFDAWMLADEQALSHVFGSTIQRQKDPETLSKPKELFL